MNFGRFCMADDKLLSLDNIFTNRIFRIPDYQRGYAWKYEQLRDFWEDVVNLQEDREHYTGLLSIKDTKTRPEKDETKAKSWDWLLEDGYKVCHVIDGQQRLTTSIILMNEIVNFVSTHSENKSETEVHIRHASLSDIRKKYLSIAPYDHKDQITYLLGYENDDPSEDYLQYCILGRKCPGEIKETYYTRNLSDAKTFFANELKNLYDKKGDKGIADIYFKVAHKLKFSLHEITDNYNVFVAFETMNNRGKKLTNLELLKNRLIYLTTLFPNNAGYAQDFLRQKINEAWKEIYRQLGRNSKFLLSDDEFLRAHWIMFFKYSRNKKAAYTSFLLNWFSQKNIDASQYIYATSTIGEDELPPVVDESNDDDNDDIEAVELQEEIKDRNKDVLKQQDILDYVDSLKEIAQLWYYTYFPNEAPDTILSEDEKLWLGKLNHIGIAYFRPIIAVSLLDKLKFSKEERLDFFKAVERFIFVNFRIGWSSSTYGSSAYYLMTNQVYHPNNEKDRKTLSDVTKQLTKTTDQNAKGDVGVFVTKMNRLFNENEGFYTWRNLKYFLFEYEYSLAKKFRRNPKLDWEQFTNVDKGFYSIEHIFPQTSTDYWNDIFGCYSSDEQRYLFSSLGNLLPLAQCINSSLQNYDFEVKKDQYRHGCHSEVEVSEKYVWNAQQIYKRGMKMLCFMAERWDFKFDSQEQMEDLLHIKFITENKEIPDNLSKYIYTGDAKLNNRITSAVKEFIKKKEDLGCVHEGVHDEEYYRFTTDAMSKIIPKEVEAESEWGTHDFYFYEFVCNEKSVSAQFAIYGVKTISDELYKLYCKINEDYKPFDTFKGKQFIRRFRSFYDLLMKTAPVEIDADMSDEDLNNVFEELYTQLIVFEKDFISKMS